MKWSGSNLVSSFFCLKAITSYLQCTYNASQHWVLNLLLTDLNEIFCQGVLITLSAIAFEKFSIKNLKGKNVTNKKKHQAICALIPFCLSFPPHHTNKWRVTGHRTKHVYVPYEILHNKTRCHNWTYHSSFLQAEIFYFL